MPISWTEIISELSTRSIRGNTDVIFSGVSTDSRTVTSGAAFIALTGERYDGEDFIADSFRKGACGAIAPWRQNASINADTLNGFIVEVEDTLVTLGDIAHIWRRRHPVPLVGITGSNGKTTTKDMLASILSRKYRVLKTEGNRNNLIGLPETLLKADGTHEAVVLELGMNKFGEIERLSRICMPDIAIITNIGAGHLEGVGSLEGVARAKGEILKGLGADGILIFNADDPMLQRTAVEWTGRKVGFGVENHDSHVSVQLDTDKNDHGDNLSVLMKIGNKEIRFILGSPGRHNIYNAAAAAAAASLLGSELADIAGGLEAWQPYKGRFELIRLNKGINLIDDSYNANPNSVTSAIKTIAGLKGLGKGILILGDMLELGSHSDEEHYRIGREAAKSGIDYIFLFGEASKSSTAKGAGDFGMDASRIILLDDRHEAVDRLKPLMSMGDWVLVKGSRGSGMEVVVEDIKRDQFLN